MIKKNVLLLWKKNMKKEYWKNIKKWSSIKKIQTLKILVE